MERALLFHGSGKPFELVRFPTPELQDTELVIRVTCCTLCRSDLHTHAGRRNEPLPTVLGHEIVGRIEAFGPGASRRDAHGTPVSVGDRVTWSVAAGCGQCYFCSDNLPQKCERLYKYGHVRVTRERPWGGGLADIVVLIPGTDWFRVPDEISDRVAAPVNCATATVAALLRHAGPIAGRRILVLGAGVLGVTACAMARAGGARAVLASDFDPASLERASAFGATHVLAARLEELAAGVADATDGRGADVVLELAGAPTSVAAGLELVRIGGVLILAGTVAPTGNVALNPEKVVRRLLTIRGVHNYHPHDLDAALRFLAGPGREFPFEKLVAATFPLDQAEDAFAHAHSRPGVRVAVVP
jgi:alcohol dehydrogenase